MTLSFNRSGFEPQHFATHLAKAPLAVFEEAKDEYRLIPASSEALSLNPSLWQALVADSRWLLSGLEKVLTWLRQPEQSPRAQQLFSGLSELELKTALGQGAAARSLAALRLDLFFDASDGLKVIEINSTIPAMQAYSDMIALAFLQAQLGHSHTSREIEEIAKAQSNSLALLNSLLRHYERAGGRKSQPRLAIVARPGDSQKAELLWHQARWQEAGYDCLLLTPDQLSHAGNKLSFQGADLDLIYRHIFAYRLPPNLPFTQALAESDTYKIFNPIAAHYELKGFLAELSRLAATEASAEKVGLNAEEQQAIQRRLPWTRLLHANDGCLGLDGKTPLVDWVKSEPARVVIKSNHGYGGHRVFVGANFGPTESQQAATLLGVKQVLSWPDFVDLCTQGKAGLWVVQERIAGKLCEQQILRKGELRLEKTYIDCSLFADTGIEPQQFGGASRFAASSVVNIGTGGGLVPFFPLGLPYTTQRLLR